MLDLNILGLYLRAVRSVGPPDVAARPAGDGARASAKGQGATDAAGREMAIRRSSRARSAFEDDHHGPRRRTWRRAAARTKAIGDADRLDRVSEAETTNYLRRLTTGERTGRARRGRQHE